MNTTEKGKQDYHINEPEWGALIEPRPGQFIIMRGKREGSNEITQIFLITFLMQAAPRDQNPYN